MKIPVVWYEHVHGGELHGRSRYGCVTMLNELFDLHDCEHWNEMSNLPVEAEGAVVVLAGGNLIHENPLVVHRINEECARLRWVVFIVIGDEEAEFPVDQLAHPNSRIWVQTPNPDRSRADRYFIVGYPNDCREMLQRYSQPKDLDWFFAGQITHDRRREFDHAVQRVSSGNGVYYSTSSFGAGLDHPTYFCNMSRARVVPCPCGPATPDTYRMAEALEAGAVPVIDAVSLNGVRGYWELVLPNNPFPIVQEWSQLPEMMDAVLGDWERIQRSCHYYWTGYKIDFRSKWLSADLEALGA